MKRPNRLFPKIPRPMERKEKIALTDLRSEIERSRLEMVRATSECKASVDVLSAEVRGNLKALNRTTQELTKRIVGGPGNPGLENSITRMEVQLKQVWWLWSVIGAVALVLLAQIIGWFKVA